MRGVVVALAVVVLLGSVLPLRVSAATATPVPALSAADDAALRSLNNLIPPQSSVMSLDDALGGASVVGSYSLVHGVNDYADKITTNDAILPTYPFTTDVTACNSFSGDTPGVGGGGGSGGGAYGASAATSTYTYQQYVNACTMGGPACAVAFQQKVYLSLGYWVGTGATLQVPMVGFTGAPAGSPAPPAQYRSTAPIWGVNLWIDNTVVRPRVTGGAIPTFAPTSIPSIWDLIGGLLTPPEIGRVFGDGLARITSAQIAVGYLKKIRIDIWIPALLQNVLKPTVQVCDYIPINVDNPTQVARASATVVKTAITGSTPVPAGLQYYNLGSNWAKVLNGQVLGYRLRCNAANIAYCVIQIKPPLTGYNQFRQSVYLPFSPQTGGGGNATCANLDGGCYHQWVHLAGSISQDLYIWCSTQENFPAVGRVCPVDVWPSVAVSVVSSIACPCVNINATRTAAVPVTPSLTAAAVIPTFQVVPTATPLPVYVPPTPLPATAVVNTTNTRTAQAAIFLTQTALADRRILTTTAAAAQNTATSAARTATSGAYSRYNQTATAIILHRAATAAAGVTQTSVAAATATMALYVQQTALAAGTIQAQITATRAAVIDDGSAIDGRDPSIVYQVADKLTESMSVFAALGAVKDLGFAFTDGLSSTPCSGLPSSIDGASLSGGWSLVGMAPALCTVRAWFAAQSSLFPYVRAILSALMVLFMLRAVFGFFTRSSKNSE
jgi:hypothetical protein